MTEVMEVPSTSCAMSTEEENFVEEVSLAMSSEMSEEVLAVVKMLEVMILVCSIYDVDFRNVADVHELDTAEDVNKNAEFVLVDPSYT